MGFYIMRTEDALDLELPHYQTDGAAGMDLRANIKDSYSIKPGEYAKVPTGVKVSLAKGYEAQIRPRSGLALQFGVTVLNSPGTVDSDYRGEINVILINHGSEAFVFNRGDRIAQMVIGRVERPDFIEVSELDETVRNGGGFGHTGLRH